MESHPQLKKVKVTLIMISAATSHQGRFASALLWSCPNVGQDQSHYEQAVNLERSIYSSHMAQNYLIFIFVYQILISCSMVLNHHEPMWIEIRMMGQFQLPNTTPAVTTSGATLKSRVRSSTDFAKRARLTGHTSPKIRSTFLKTRSLSPKTRSTFPKIRSMSPKTSSTFPTNRSQCKLVSQPTQLENLAGGFPSSWALIGFFPISLVSELWAWSVWDICQLYFARQADKHVNTYRWPWATASSPWTPTPGVWRSPPHPPRSTMSRSVWFYLDFLGFGFKF